MTPPEFYGSKVCDNSNGFIDEVYKVLEIIRVSFIEKAELSSYQLKDLAQIWYEKLKVKRIIGASSIEWETF